MTSVSEYFDQRAELWDAEGAGTEVPSCIPALAGVRAGSRVLDIGCGTGAIDAMLLSAGAAHVDALDVSAGMIAQARAKYAAEPRVSFHCCDIVDYVPSKDGRKREQECEDEHEGEHEDGRRREDEHEQARYDSAVLYNMYPHIANKQAVAQKLRGLLAPGGRFAIIHGKGREAINRHHAAVPAEVTSELLPAETEARVWRETGYDIDTIIDRPDLYCISGVLR